MNIYEGHVNPDYYSNRSNEMKENEYAIEIVGADMTKADSSMVKWHWHSEIEITYISSGSAYITCDQNTITAKCNDIVLINQNTHHFFTSSDETGFIFQSIILHPSYIFGFGQLAMDRKYILPVILDSNFKYLHISKSNDNYEIYHSIVQDIIQLDQEKPITYELLIKSKVLQLWSILYQDITSRKTIEKSINFSVQDEPRVKDAILYIQEHFNESVTLDDIANSISVSKSECCRCFKRTLNCTPFEYLMKYRIQESTRYMHLRQQYSISEIAGMVGFNNISYYNKIFKKFMNCTPSEYRKNLVK